MAQARALSHERADCKVAVRRREATRIAGLERYVPQTLSSDVLKLSSLNPKTLDGLRFLRSGAAESCRRRSGSQSARPGNHPVRFRPLQHFRTVRMQQPAHRTDANTP